MSEIGSPTSFTERAFYECGLYDGSIAERAAIVAWLRSEACFTWLRRNTGGFTAVRDLDMADDLSVAISDGEHLRGNDEE